MSTPLNAALARLRTAIAQLDKASVTALRAEADARQAHTHYTEAGHGTDHPKIEAAIAESTIAGDKAAKVGRLISEAIGHVATYANIIAPGSIPTTRASQSTTPSGEDLVAGSIKRASTRSGTAAFLAKLTDSAGDVQERTEATTESAQKIVNVLRHRNDPSGVQTTPPVTTSTVLRPEPLPKIEAPEAAGNLAVIGLVAGLVIYRTTVRFRREARLNARDRKDGTE